jgi:hypothetical protein
VVPEEARETWGQILKLKAQHRPLILLFHIQKMKIFLEDRLQIELSSSCHAVYL